MRWLAVLSILAVFGSISSAENHNNYGSRLQSGSFNPLYNKYQNFGPIRQHPSNWHHRNNFGDGNGHYEEETTDDLDEDEESDPDLDSDDDNLEDGDENDQELDEIKIDARQGNNVDDLPSQPAVKNQQISVSGSLVSRKSQATTDDFSSVSESVTSNDAAEENSSKPEGFGEASDNEIYHYNSQSQSGNISNLFGGLLGSALLSSRLNKNIGKGLEGGSLKEIAGTKLTGDIPSFLAELLASSIPKSTLSNGLNRGVSKIGNLRNSVLDFRDRALDQRVGIIQGGQPNQFDPDFQASLSHPSSHGADQLTWNSLSDLVTKLQTGSPAVQKNKQGVKTGILGILGNGKEFNKESDKNINNSSTKKDEESNQSKRSGLLGLLGNSVSNKKQDSNNDSSDKGGRFQFLTNAKDFAINPVGFVERRIRNKIKQKIKNDIQQSVSDLTNRVDSFKSNMTGLAGELVESFKSKPPVKKSNCLKILTGPQAHQLYLNGKPIPQARIFYVDKPQPLDFNSCPINHQDKVLENCLFKGNVLILCQPDKVKVEEEHGRQLEMIIAKDVIKDRLNGMVDTFFQNFGRQALKGMHILRGDKN